MRKILICAMLFFQMGMVFAFTYPQRFFPVTSLNRAVWGDGLSRRVGQIDRLLVRCPWLQDLEQPEIVEVVSDLERHDITPPIFGLPSEFTSNHRTTYRYGDDTEASFIYVSRSDPHYATFAVRTAREKRMAMVVVRYGDGELDGRYIYSERPFTYVQDQYRTAGFSFEDILARASSPVLNVASGGNGLATALAKIRYAQSKSQIDVFSLDVAGSRKFYYGYPFYLFADGRNTDLPDDTFGLVISIGGPLRTLNLEYTEGVSFLREMHRVAKSEGMMLVEHAVYPETFFDLLYEAGINYESHITYETVTRKGKKSFITEIQLDKYLSGVP